MFSQKVLLGKKGVLKSQGPKLVNQQTNYGKLLAPFKRLNDDDQLVNIFINFSSINLGDCSSKFQQCHI